MIFIESLEKPTDEEKFHFELREGEILVVACHKKLSEDQHFIETFSEVLIDPKNNKLDVLEICIVFQKLQEKAPSQSFETRSSMAKKLAIPLKECLEKSDESSEKSGESPPQPDSWWCTIS